MLRILYNFNIFLKLKNIKGQKVNAIYLSATAFPRQCPAPSAQCPASVVAGSPQYNSCSILYFLQIMRSGLVSVTQLILCFEGPCLLGVKGAL